MIRELIEKVRDEEDVCRGECFMVHLTKNGRVKVMPPVALSKFVREWHHLGGEDLQRVFEFDWQLIPWLAVIHDRGAMLAPLSCAVARTMENGSPTDRRNN
jgi:hypothetical protein